MTESGLSFIEITLHYFETTCEYDNYFIEMSQVEKFVRNGEFVPCGNRFAVMVMCIPAIQIIVINLIIGNEPKHMSVGLVNHEIGQVNETGGMACPYSAGCLASGAGCKYVSSLPEEQVIMVRKVYFIYLYSNRLYKSPELKHIPFVVQF